MRTVDIVSGVRTWLEIVGKGRAPGKASMWERVFWVLGLVLLAAGAGCGGGGQPPVSAAPSLPPPRPPPPLTDTLFLGFVEDRIEITEGEGAAVEIAFEPFYTRVRDPNARGPEGFPGLYVAAEVEPGTAAAEDLLVRGVQIGDYGRFPQAGTTWLAIRALPNGVAEGSESLTLRLRPQRSEHDYPPAIEMTNAELEVVIRDREVSGICGNIHIVGAKPRNVTVLRHLEDGPPCRFEDVFETEVAVESDREEGLQLDRIHPLGRIDGWRVEAAGPRLRHHLVVQWEVGLDRDTWEMRLEPCPLTGSGPTLVCTVDTCETYGAGSQVPAPRRPTGCRE